MITGVESNKIFMPKTQLYAISLVQCPVKSTDVVQGKKTRHLCNFSVKSIIVVYAEELQQVLVQFGL